MHALAVLEYDSYLGTLITLEYLARAHTCGGMADARARATADARRKADAKRHRVAYLLERGGVVNSNARSADARARGSPSKKFYKHALYKNRLPTTGLKADLKARWLKFDATRSVSVHSTHTHARTHAHARARAHTHTHMVLPIIL